MNTPTLHTRRLILRKFNPDDIQALFLILKDEEANRFLPWYPVKTVEEAKKFYQESVDLPRQMNELKQKNKMLEQEILNHGETEQSAGLGFE